MLHPNLLFLGDLFPTRGQPVLILSFLEASPVARRLRKRMMPGSFLEMVGGDVSEINRHRYFRSPGLLGRVDLETGLSVLPAKAR